MSEQHSRSFQRIFVRRDLFAGPARTGLLWSVLAALLLVALLLVTGLLVGLLTDQGRLSAILTEDQVPRFERLTGQTVIWMEAPEVADVPAGPADAAAPLPDNRPPTQLVVADDSGVIPAVWRLRDRPWGRTLEWIVLRAPPLRSNVSALMVLLPVLALLALARMFALSRVNLQARRAALEAAQRLQKSIHRQALRLGPEDLNGETIASAQRMFSVEARAISGILHERLRRLLREPIELIAVILVALAADPLLTLQWVLPLSLGFYLWHRGRARFAQTRQLADDRIRSEFEQLGSWLHNSRLVRGYAMEANEHDAFDNQLRHFYQTVRQKTRLMDVPLWYGWLGAIAVGAAGVFLMLLLGAKILSPTVELSFPGAVVFLATVPIGLGAARRLVELPRLNSDLSVAADQVYRFLDAMPTVSQAVGARFLNPLSRTLHFEGVTYHSPARKILLDHVDLKLEAGETYAVVSLNPEEAKALLLLLPRFLEPRSGRILFDGEDIAWVTLESLRAETVYVGADDPPFIGSVVQNIRAGGEFPLSKVIEAAKAVHAHNFISQLPQGYETTLLHGDDSLNVGQRFRLGLARALLREPALMVIEEPSRALDEDTKNYLADTYERLIPGRTVFFKPTRMSTLRRADAVILLHHGRVIAVGPQAKLLSDVPLYRHWEYMHFNEFRHASEG